MNASPAIATPSPSPVKPATAALWAGMLLAITIWIFWAFFERQFRFAIEQQADWGHTLVIPFIAGWFVWLNRDRILESPLQPSVTGLIIMAGGLAWYSVAALGPAWLRHHNLMGMGVGAAIFGIVLAFCGWRAMRYLWFPVAYLVVFGQTVSDRFLDIITFQLQGIATIGSEYGLALLGYDISREGHTLSIHEESGRVIPLNIAEACSGMRMLVAFFALGVAMAYRGLDTLWQRITLVVMAVPTAVFVNVLRVMTLGILSIYDSGFATGEFHLMIGMLWLIPAFFIYLGVMWILKNIIVSNEDAAEPSEDSGTPVSIRFGSNVTGVFVTSVLVLVVGGIGFSVLANALDVHLRKQPVPLRESLGLIPSSIGPWRMIDEAKFDDAFIEQLGTPFTISRVYQHNDGGQIVQFHVAYYTDTIDAIPHVPDRCMVASGLRPRTSEPTNIEFSLDIDDLRMDDRQLAGHDWPVIDVASATGETQAVHLPVGTPLIRTMEFNDDEAAGQRIWAGYFFITNGQMTPAPSGVKLISFMGPDSHAYYAKVQLIAGGGSQFGQDEYLDTASGFLSLTLPHVMRVLPDWADVLDGNIPSSESGNGVFSTQP